MIKVLGLDPALRNLGIVESTYDLSKLLVSAAMTYKTKSRDKKKSSLSNGEHDTYCAMYLSQMVTKHITIFKPDLICVEIGSGAQSHSAAAALGAMKGFIGSLMAQYDKISWVIVSPNEAKLIVKAKADKKLIMAWVQKHHKEYDWDTTQCRFEHMADAVIVIYAGVKKYVQRKGKLR